MSGPPSLDSLAINLATVRQQWNLREAVEACARHGITAVDPWRDQVAALGLAELVRVIKANGMRVTGYCRGGMFPAADAAGRQAAIDDNKRAIDEAAALGPNALCWWSAACHVARATSAPRAPW